MKVSVFKNFLNGERITTCSVEDVAQIISRGDYAEAISDYRCAAPSMLAANISDDIVNNGVRMADNSIPRLCFAAEYRRHNGGRQLQRRNALVLLEIDGLADYATVVNMRNAAAHQPYTLLAFIGANGLSVEIVCRISQTDGRMPANDDSFRRLMAEGYKRLHYVYSSQLGVSIPLLTPADDAMCLMSADAGAYYESHAVAFAVDMSMKPAVFVGEDGCDASGNESPLPGKTPDEARRYIFYSCWDAVLRSGLDASESYFAEQAIAMLARFCRRSGLPEQMCVERASLIDGINADRDLVTMLFRQAYAARPKCVNPTGSRRFVCAAVTGRIDFTSPVDYPQLYAQLVDEVRCGLPYYLDVKAEQQLMDENRRFFRNADIDSILSSLFRQPSSAETAQELTASEIAAIVRREYPKLPPSRLSTVEIGRRMKAAGFQGRHTERGTCYQLAIV